MAKVKAAAHDPTPPSGGERETRINAVQSHHRAQLRYRRFSDTWLLMRQECKWIGGYWGEFPSYDPKVVFQDRKEVLEWLEEQNAKAIRSLNAQKQTMAEPIHTEPLDTTPAERRRNMQEMPTPSQLPPSMHK